MDVEPLDLDRVGNQRLLLEVSRHDVGAARQRMLVPHHQDLFVVEDGLAVQALAADGIRGDQHVDLMTEERPDATELKLLLHVEIDVGKRAQIAVGARAEVDALLGALPEGRVLSLGVVSGRNIWKADLAEALDLTGAAQNG